ncbi:hypothetical protein [Pseudomonas sp. WAC2]|nr:hypothetical protein [Pseudomonas sp. WAC2]MDN3235576.1 hypothetical protein [Pseudomonas sp. WAC2]
MGPGILAVEGGHRGLLAVSDNSTLPYKSADAGPPGPINLAAIKRLNLD